jgi:alpha-aminoadipic semialdehyde synthase
MWNSLLVSTRCSLVHEPNFCFSASNDLKGANSLVASHDNASAVSLNVSDESALQSLIGAVDLVIRCVPHTIFISISHKSHLSLLPVSLHAVVAKVCIANQKHLVTASYISPEMRNLHDQWVYLQVIGLSEFSSPYQGNKGRHPPPQRDWSRSWH